jgi:uncharacterized protein (DUF924 family)
VNWVVVASQGRQVRNLFKRVSAGLEENLKWAGHYREIICRFGRFPHRNTIQGHTSSPEETEWMASPGAFSP